MKLKRNKEMEFETLKKSHKKQIAIGAIVVCVVGGALTFATTRAKYRVTQDIPLVSGTVNYKAYDFKIMAMYKQNDAGTYDEITDKRMPGADYFINTSKSYCTPDNVNKDTSAVIKTENGKHIIENLQKSDKCYLWFDKVKIKNSSDIIKYSKINTNAVDFSKVATTDEGIYATHDGMYGGTSYYWRGVATTNHLIFANKCWRIVRINGDKSIRIIYNGNTKGTAPNLTCAGNGTNANSIAVANQLYNTSYDNPSYVGWVYTKNEQRQVGAGTNSNAANQTFAWYNSNIKNNTTFDTKVVTGKFCNDRNVDSAPSSWSGYTTTWAATGTQFAYAGAKRLFDLHLPILSCSYLDTYNMKVGAITADEVMLAGGNYNSSNSSYYLYNGQHYWTMSPSNWDGSGALVFIVNSTGYLDIAWVKDTYGLRPVINLSAGVTFSQGNGTQNSPYIVS